MSQPNSTLPQTRDTFTRVVDDLTRIGERVRQRTTSPGDPIRREFGRVKASFIRLAVLMGENDAARQFIEDAEQPEGAIP